MEKIQLVDLSIIPQDAYKKHLADVVILTSKNKILLQSRPLNWLTHPGVVCLFGGHVEDEEVPIEAAVREIHEETGGILSSSDLIFIGALTEDWTNHSQIVHVYFWYDKDGSITGCYEAEAIEFNSSSEAISHNNIMDYAKWALEECNLRNLLPTK